LTGEVVRILRLPFEALRTIYAGDCEVRLYRNEVTSVLEVGKRVDLLGLDGSILAQEATWLSRIRHDHLVPVHSVATVAGFPAPMRVIEMIMPYYERGSIADALGRGERFSIAGARDHVLATLRGLGQLHEVENILHRDMKSPNVLLTGDARLARVGDLGVGAQMDEDGSAEAYASAQLYSAPEAFTTHRVDRRSDIYAVGLLLFEMANGPLPWDAYDDRLAMAKRLAAGRPAPLPRHLKFSPTVPPGMRRLVGQAMSGDPERRPPTAMVMATRLAGIPLIDWSLLDEDESGQVWQGRSSIREDRLYRVEAGNRPRYGVRLSGLQRVNRWRRVVPDQDVADLGTREATAFFDQMVAIATRR
jgi:eukaryotic-like serine/threonine-protein kinase